MMFLGKPLFVWFGILAGLTVILTLISGLRKVKMNTHKMLAYLAVAFIALHLLGIFGVY
jgi:uncharacterized membrane protein